MLAELKNLAEERSSEKRLDLLRKITDLFLAEIDKHSDLESSLFNEVVERIVDQVERDAKIDVATNLATLPGFPLPVVRNLARDGDIEIAGPVLGGALGLTDRELIEIGRLASDDHLDAIAGRAQLSAPLTDVLIDRGSRDVVHAVSANHGASFSEWGMDALVSKARNDDGLQDLLVARPDLPQKAVDQLSSIVSEVLARKLAERGYQVSGKIPANLVKTTQNALASAVQDRDQNLLMVGRIIAQFGAGQITLEVGLTEVIKCRQMLAVAAILSHHTKLNRTALLKILNDGTSQAVMVLLRALEVKWPTVAALMALRAMKQRTSQMLDTNKQRDYEAIDVAAAKRTLEFLHARSKTFPGAAASENSAVA
jgi:Uncharacterised protein conserved in bacteria (DUF2336)